ncbi:MAG: IS200/IS605 family transposase [Bacteroidales bacterium]|nr:IS200/IS605 family transposase [Bacteroidales bacterium]MBR4219386.1 IS200/IS605 family transposase [Bacteroidales bacterium]
MNNTYTQIHIQAVFAVKYRESLISSEWKRRLYQYMIAIINDQGHKTLAIGGTANHLHILFGFRPTQSLSSLMLRVKRESSEWINKEHLTKRKFQWQEGYGAFSYTKKDLPTIIQYIQNQEIHHEKKPFREEYLELLKRHEVEYDERYIFDDI